MPPATKEEKLIVEIVNNFLGLIFINVYNFFLMVY